MNSTPFVCTGHGSSLYWATVSVTADGVPGVYVLDTGSRALVTRKKVNKEGSYFPHSILYGSGRVWGHKTFAAVRVAPGVLLPRTDVLQGANVKLGPNVDGVLGLLPGTPTAKAGLRSVEIDFANQSLHWNRPPVHRSAVCVNADLHQHQRLQGRLWLRGDMRAIDVGGSVFHRADVHFMLDTGATKAATFCRANFSELGECTRRPGLMRLEVKVGNTTLVMPLATGSWWPICLPRNPADIGFVIVGLQALSALKSIHFEYSQDGGRITRLCVAQHP